MDRSATAQGFTKPVGGFIVVLAVAVIVGTWLYVDMAKNELEMKIEKVSAELEASKRAAEQAAPAPAPAAPKMKTYAAALGEYRFQVDLPEGHHLSVQEGGMGDLGAYVLMDSTAENVTPTPDMHISLVSLAIEAYASMLGNEEPGTRLIPTPNGEFAFWIRGWEDQVWPEFDTVAATFKAL